MSLFKQIQQIKSQTTTAIDNVNKIVKSKFNSIEI